MQKATGKIKVQYSHFEHALRRGFSCFMLSLRVIPNSVDDTEIRALREQYHLSQDFLLLLTLKIFLLSATVMFGCFIMSSPMDQIKHPTRKSNNLVLNCFDMKVQRGFFLSDRRGLLIRKITVCLLFSFCLNRT